MEKPLRHFHQRLHRWFNSPIEELNRSERRLRLVIDFIRNCVGELTFDRAPQMAAALTYHTLFSLMPMVVLMFVVSAAFINETQLQQMQDVLVDALVRPLYGQEELAPNSEIDTGVATGPVTSVGEPGGGGMDAFELAMAEQQEIQREQSERAFAEAVHYVLERLEQVNFRGIGVVGILIFIYAATGLLTTIEKSFNTIFDVSRSRPVYLRLPLYYTTITLAPLLIIGAQVLQGWIIDLIDEGAWTTWLARGLVVITPLLTTWVVFALLYMLLPNTRVRWRPALIGAAVSAVLWVGAVELFGWYVSSTPLMGLYGALALGPLFMLWLYITWLIILFGLELTFVVQSLRGRTLKHLRWRQTEDHVIDRAWLLPILAEIAGRFEAGQSIATPQLAATTELPRRVVERMARALESAGLIHQVDGRRSRDDHYTLARPAERITAQEVLAVGDALVQEEPGQPGPAWALVQRMHDKAREIGQNLTLRDLLHGQTPTAGESGDAQTATASAAR